jgi:hypothetical protein
VHRRQWPLLAHRAPPTAAKPEAAVPSPTPSNAVTAGVAMAAVLLSRGGLQWWADNCLATANQRAEEGGSNTTTTDRHHRGPSTAPPLNG